MKTLAEIKERLEWLESTYVTHSLEDGTPFGHRFEIGTNPAIAELEAIVGDLVDCMHERERALTEARAVFGKAVEALKTL